MDPLRRAYATLDVKGIDDEQRILVGVASTPSLDRHGDSMDPTGAEFTLPLPLLAHHRQDQPIGTVLDAAVSAKGIRIRAQIAKDSGLDYVEHAWRQIKAGLTRGLSIGWRPLEAPTEIKGGYRWGKWTLAEISAVTVPANVDASILSIKTYAVPPASRLGSRPPAGASALPTSRFMNLSDQITALEHERTTIADRMATLMDPVVKGEAADLADEVQTEYDGLVVKLKTLDTRRERLLALESSQALTLKDVNGNPAHANGGFARPFGRIQVEEPKLPPGMLFTRAVICQIGGKMLGVAPWDLAKQRYPSHPSLQAFTKAAVAGATTTGTGDSPDTGWGAQLMPATQLVTTDFMEFLRPQTIVGRIPNLSRIPFNSAVGSQNVGGAAGWVGEALLKPVTAFGYDSTPLGHTKVAAIAVVSKDWIRFTNGEERVRNALRDIVVARMDIDFVDPGKTAAANVSPASITNGLTPLAPNGADVQGVLADLQALIGAFITDGQRLGNLVWIMPSSLALALALMRNSDGSPAFAGMTPLGGTLVGYPVVASEHLAQFGSPDNSVVILANASEIFLADDGNVTVEASNQASIEMSTVPNSESGAVVSMFQSNQIALLAEREICWMRGRLSSVNYIQGATWSAAGSP